MKKFALAVSILAISAIGASAADLAPRYAKAAPPMAEAVYNWTGFYVGVNGGGGMASSNHQDPDCFTCADTKFQQPFGTVGIGAGYNYQFGHTVLGIEGDYNWASVDKTKPWALDDGSSSAGTTQFKMREFATLRARGGLALDRTFLYVTAGLAFAHVQNTTLQGVAFTPFILSSQASEDKWKTGLAVGGGVEFALSQNWTLKGEYLFMTFADSEASLLNVPPRTGFTCNTPSSTNCRINYSESLQLARVGLNYKFDWGSSPIVARY
jgi:outer membrane immunogenic protein